MASAFMQQRAAGYQPDEIPEADQMELVNLMWDAEEGDVLRRAGSSPMTTTGCLR